MAVKEALISSAVAGGSGLAGTGAQLYTNWRNREFEKEQSQLQRDWSELMYQNQNAWNYEMWQKQNEYNTPSAQVQRLRDAGLNPLFYGLDGTGNASALTAAQPLGYDRASVGNQINPLSVGIDAALKVAQVSNIQANTAKQNNENITETARREKLLAETENTKQELNNLRSQQGLTESQKQQIELAIAWTDRLNEAIIAEKDSSAKLNESTKKRIDTLLEGERLLQVKNLRDFDHKWKKIDAEIKKISAETELDYLDIKNYTINHMNNGIMGSGLSINNLARSWAGTVEAGAKAIEKGWQKVKGWFKD